MTKPNNTPTDTQLDNWREGIAIALDMLEHPYFYEAADPAEELVIED